MNNIKYIFMIVSIAMLLMVGQSFAGTQGMKLTLPDGSVVPVDGLNADEIKSMTDMMNKVIKVKAKAPETAEKVSQMATDMLSNPERLDAWRKTITGTIKDICNDLNVSVNDFIKTPVGNGVVVYLAYNLIGKDVLAVTARVLFLVPFWCIIICILFYLQRKYLSVTTVYDKKEEIVTENGKTKTLYSHPEREITFPWGSNDARIAFACVLFGVGIISTVMLVVLIFK